MTQAILLERIDKATGEIIHVLRNNAFLSKTELKTRAKVFSKAVFDEAIRSLKEKGRIDYQYTNSSCCSGRPAMEFFLKNTIA